jgi:protein TonB
MLLKMPWRTLMSATLVFVGAFAQAAPLLNGISVHQELGNEQFIGALYSDILSDNADTLVSSPVAKRMELKVVSAEGLAVRRFSRMWIEGMAINNNSNLLTAQADNMVRFDGLLKGRLQKNDHVVFSMTPGEGVSITINDVLLDNIADDQFFQLLLSTWIGRVPLSSSYKSDLLKMGDVAANLRTRYEGIRPDPARSREIAAWNNPEPAASSSSSSAVAVVARSSAAPLPPARVELPALAAQPAPVVSSQAASSEAPALPPQMAVASPAATDEEDDDDDEVQPALTAESLLARQFYVSDMLKKIRSSVRYPRRAQERNQEGGVRISITVDQQGSIRSMSWIEESRYDLLNKEAWEAVQRAAPFPPIPASMNVQSFQFSAPITFEMRR